MVNIELKGCGDMTDAVETDVVETDVVEARGVEKTGPVKFKEEAGVLVLEGLAGAPAVERASRKREGVENTGTVGKVSKRSKS